MFTFTEDIPDCPSAFPFQGDMPEFDGFNSAVKRVAFRLDKGAEVENEDSLLVKAAELYLAWGLGKTEEDETEEVQA